MEATAENRVAARIQPDNAIAHFKLGLVLAAQESFGAAIAEYREAIRLQPDLAAARYHLGQALRAGGMLEQAVVEFRMAHDHAQRDSELAQKIERALTEFDH